MLFSVVPLKGHVIEVGCSGVRVLESFRGGEDGDSEREKERESEGEREEGSYVGSGQDDDAPLCDFLQKPC